MYLNILLLPLLGSVFSGLLGRKIGISGSHFITIFCLILTSILVTFAFYEVALCSNPVTIYLTSWIDSELLNVSWEFMFDQLTVSMLIPVIYISTVVHIFSISYMNGDPHNQRFFSYLSLFTFFMIVLVTGGNYLIMFIGWEGIGVVSFLLINFWFTRLSANKAAILAFTQNRVGDMFLSMGFFSMVFIFGTLDFDTIYSISPYINTNLITIVSLLLLLGAMAKSSQIGLHNWLPGSMEGPTPVSSLIHAATLVTAGLYLLMRSSPILEYSSTALFIITLVGSITSFFAASTGLAQNDIKRIIAFSTISQLGYMVMAIGLSQYNVALFHLVNHAFFKALLFLSAGSIIHSMQDNQDLRRYGGLINFLPFTYTAILIGSLSLMALPWLTGFYSKDLILELAYAQYELKGSIAWVLGSITAMFTAFYSFKLISLTFLGYPNASKKTYNNVHEADLFVIIPLVVLSIFSIFFGYIGSDLYIGIGTDIMGFSLFQHPNNTSLVEAEFSLPTLIKLFPAILTLLGAFSALLLYNKYILFLFEVTQNTKLGYIAYTFLNGKYLLDVIYNKYIIKSGFNLGYTLSKYLDRGIFEYVGPLGLSLALSSSSKKLSNFDNSIITSYVINFILSTFIFIFIIFFYL